MYTSIINLIPPHLEQAKAYLIKIIDWLLPNWGTLSYSIDDAIALVGGPNATLESYIRCWNFNLFPLADQTKILESGQEILYLNMPGWEPYIKDVSAALTQTPGYSIREEEDITHLVIHHSVGWHQDRTNEENAELIAHFHVNTRGWPGIGYHFLICPDGEILQTNQIRTESYHAAYNNDYSIGICLGGDFRHHWPSQSQLLAATSLVHWLRQNLPNHLALSPHKRMPQAATACPGELDVDGWLKIVDGQDEPH